MSRRTIHAVKFNKHTLADQPRSHHEQRVHRREALRWFQDESFNGLPITVIYKRSVTMPDGTSIRLDVIELKKTLKYFLRRIVRRLYGTSACKSGARLQTQFVWEDGEIRGLHSQGRIERPVSMTNFDFEQLLNEEATHVHWIQYVRLEEKDLDEWKAYILKLARKGCLLDHIDEINTWWLR